MQAPVTKRSTTIAGDVGSNSRMAPLAAAATKAAPMKNRRGSSRSASPKPALIKVPITKPSWTALVSSDAVASSRPACALSAGTTAEAENHTAIAATSQKTMIAIDAPRPVVAAACCSLAPPDHSIRPRSGLRSPMGPGTLASRAGMANPLAPPGKISYVT